MAKREWRGFIARSLVAGLLWYVLVVGGFLFVWMSGMLDPIIYFFERMSGFQDHGPLLFWLPGLVGWLPIVFFATVLMAVFVETRHPMWKRRALLCFAVVWGWLLSTILWICMFPDDFFFYATAAIGYVVGIIGYLVLERLAFKKGPLI